MHLDCRIYLKRLNGDDLILKYSLQWQREAFIGDRLLLETSAQKIISYPNNNIYPDIRGVTLNPRDRDDIEILTLFLRNL